MLKELVKERLMAAADEIFALFESTITSYEEELSRTREEKERHRQQLEAVCKTQIVLHVEDIQQLSGRREVHPPTPQDGRSALRQEDPQPTHLKEEKKEGCISQSGEECLLGPQEADLTKLPLTGDSVKTEDHEDKPQVDHLIAPLSDSDDITSHSAEDKDEDYTQVPLSSDTDGGGDTRTHTDNQHPECSEKKTDKKGSTCSFGAQSVCNKEDSAPHTDGQQRRQEEHPPTPREGSSTLMQEDPQPPHIKEEEEELWISQSGEECFLGPREADLTKLPLTGVSVKTEDHEDKPQVDNLLAPLSDSDDMTSHSAEDEDEDNTQEPLSSDTDCEGGMRTHTDNKHPECSENKTDKKRFTCSLCAKSFCVKKDFARHTRTHTGEKPFSCSFCSQRFTQKDNMISHMRTHTGEKPFSCSLCCNNFSQRSTLTAHMRTHTGEKPFSCSVCASTFSHKGSLTVHMRKHTGEKPFTCSICGDTFSRRASMELHMRKHTGEKPFSCSVCDKGYYHKKSLRAHMSTHDAE
ncbi:uncharacterized protein [Nerophis lumbriciformis]|uniref:uncharacterized protein n=1 Tax=Nerophis lumbriciformis TaxID=546530 RepID=UPI003BAA1035